MGMGNSFLDFMKHLGIFIICAQSLMHFAAGKSYEKYVKLLIGIIILAQFADPVKTFFAGEGQESIMAETERFRLEMEEAAAAGDRLEEPVQMENYVKDDIENRLSPIATAYGYRIKETTISGDPPMITIIAAADQKDKAADIKIEKITITDANYNKGNGDINGDDKMKDKKAADSQVLQKMREEFCICLGTEEAYLNVFPE